jgi:hypothetical protein
MKASDRIMAATLMVVAAMANRMINLEKEGSLFRAIRLAINRGVFKNCGCPAKGTVQMPITCRFTTPNLIIFKP